MRGGGASNTSFTSSVCKGASIIGTSLLSRKKPIIYPWQLIFHMELFGFSHSGSQKSVIVTSVRQSKQRKIKKIFSCRKTAKFTFYLNAEGDYGWIFLPKVVFKSPKTSVDRRHRLPLSFILSEIRLFYGTAKINTDSSLKWQETHMFWTKTLVFWHRRKLMRTAKRYMGTNVRYITLIIPTGKAHICGRQAFKQKCQ